MLVPVEIDREVDPGDMVDGYLPDTEDHVEYAKEAMIAAKGMQTVKDCISTLGAAAIRAKSHGDGITAELSPFAGLAEDVVI